MAAQKLLVPIEPAEPGAEAATSLLHISRTRVYELMNSGALQSVKIGRRRLVVRDSIDAYVASLVAAPPETVAS